MSKLIYILFLFFSSIAIADNEFRDCPICPIMKQVPQGEFILGSPKSEAGRVEDEGPRTKVAIQKIAISKFEITRREFAAFIEDTNYRSVDSCYLMQENGAWNLVKSASWRSPGFQQSAEHPVVCVSWQDALAYTEWLNLKSQNHHYRLLSESEWEYAARSGSASRYWWGENEDDFCKYTNGADKSAREKYPLWEKTGNCSDSFVYTAPVGNYGIANSFGLYDLVGNVWEWVADCYRPNYEKQPRDGSAFTSKNCSNRVFRGGAWGDYGSFYLRTAYRGEWKSTEAFANIGFRVAASIK